MIVDRPVELLESPAGNGVTRYRVVSNRGPGLDAVVDYLRTRPGAGVLYTNCTDGSGSPRGFYLRHGFTDTARIMWGENVLTLDLAPRD